MLDILVKNKLPLLTNVNVTYTDSASKTVR